MKIDELTDCLHKYIREEFIAISERNGNEIRIHFLDGAEYNIAITKK